MQGSQQPDDGFADVDASALLAGLSASEVSEQPLAREALPTLTEASGLSRRRAKEWSEAISDAAPTEPNRTGCATGLWRSPTDLVQATTSLFTAAPLAIEHFERETSDAVLRDRRDRLHDTWATKLAAAAATADPPEYELTVSVTPVTALAATGERACSETVVRVSSPATGREQLQYERVAHLRVGRLVVALVTREPGPVGTNMAGVLGRYETRLREQAGHYR